MEDANIAIDDGFADLAFKEIDVFHSFVCEGVALGDIGFIVVVHRDSIEIVFEALSSSVHAYCETFSAGFTFEMSSRQCLSKVTHIFNLKAVVGETVRSNMLTASHSIGIGVRKCHQTEKKSLPTKRGKTRLAGHHRASISQMLPILYLDCTPMSS